ncbi:MAG: DUF6497 family protein [Rhodobacteraceae bacterium]|nr:DUF6497 family protein [Paracoccaceae bacterium]
MLPTAVIAAGFALIAGPGQCEQLIPVPSGQPLSLGEVLIDDTQGKDWIRFRFIAPRIGEGGVDYQLAAPDMDYLCQHLAIPYLAEYALKPARVIISLSDRMVEFGKANSEATQYFEAYRPENNTCIWEDF